MPTKRTQDKKKRKKKTNRATAPSHGDDASNVSNEVVAKPWEVEKREEIARMEELISDNWIPLTVAKAPWIRFSADPKIKAAFDAPLGTTQEQGLEWLQKAENSIVQFILHKRILENNHVEQFRCLGRGWIFVMLRRQENKFKFWFESVKRIEMEHEVDLKALDLTGEMLKKHTYGYKFESELVFYVKGLVPKRNTQPVISIQTMVSNYKGLSKWATNEQVMNTCKNDKIATDEERKEIADRTRRRQKRRQRAKAKRNAKQEEEHVTNHESMELQKESTSTLRSTLDQKIARDWLPDFKRCLSDASQAYESSKIGNLGAVGVCSWFACLVHRNTSCVRAKLAGFEKNSQPQVDFCTAALPTMYPSVAVSLGYRYLSLSRVVTNTTPDLDDKLRRMWKGLHKEETSNKNGDEHAFFW